VQNKELIPYLGKLIRHPSEEIKALVLKMAHHYDELDLTSEASLLAKANDETLRNEAVRYLCERSADPLEALRNYLNQDDHRVRSAALIYAAKKLKESKQFRSAINLKQLIDDMLKNLETPGYEESQKRFIKTNVARIIGITGDPNLSPYLNLLLRDQSPDVVRTAVVSAGQIQSRECTPALIRYLGTKEVRKYARQALAEYGEEIIDTLAQHLENPKEDPKIRQSIPRVLALIGSQKSVDVLLNSINQRDLVLRYQVMKALNKLRLKFPALRSNKTLIEERILEETKHYYRTLAILYRQRNPQSAVGAESAVGGFGGNSKARQLLISALEEKLDDNLERIFRLLGLRYQPKDMYNAYLGITSRKSTLRAEAVEFLDNVLKADLKKIIIPIAETTPTEVLMAKIRELFGFDLPSEEECIHLLLGGDDNWLKVCTLYYIAEMNYTKYLEFVPKFDSDPAPLVRETSKYCLDSMRRLS
jgi:AAA family ATP:ADP antiporter